MKKIRFLLLTLCLLGFHACFMPVLAQNSVNSVHFIEYQKTFPKISEMISREEDTLQKQFAAKQLVWPARYVYIRSFKYDS